MTLIVAALEDGVGWMAGDTAVTGPAMHQRTQEFLPKIEVSENRRALYGFAGASEFGSAAVRVCAQIADPQDALVFLCARSLEGEVDFLHMYLDGADNPKLKLITKGIQYDRNIAYIGSHSAFNIYQSIKNGERLPYAPDAFKKLMIGSRSDVPAGLSTAVSALIDLFATNESRDVGGWVTPFILRKDCAEFAGYSYFVSDPLFKEWSPGQIIPHGTATLGGGNLSVTEVADNRGAVVYWLQKPGGIVCLRENEGYKLYSFAGNPSDFKDKVSSELGVEAQLWVGDQDTGPLQRMIVRRGPDGSLEQTVGIHGNALTFAIHNLATPFHSNIEINLESNEIKNSAKRFQINRIDENHIELKIEKSIIKLSAIEIEDLIMSLGTERGNLYPIVPLSLKGLSVLADVDPAWQVDANLHPGLQGATLALRHKSFGWQSFVLPMGTVRKLGEWLVGFAAHSGRETR